LRFETRHVVLQGSKDFLKGMGLGLIADQLADLKLGELLNTPPPGLDEAVAIGKVKSCDNMHGLIASNKLCYTEFGPTVIYKPTRSFHKNGCS